MTKKEKQVLSVAADAAKETGTLSVGEWVAIIGVNPIYFGRLTAWDEGHYHLAEASWVVETGRANEFVKDPQKACQEAEYLGSVTVERAAIQAIYRYLPAGKIETR